MTLLHPSDFLLSGLHNLGCREIYVKADKWKDKADKIFKKTTMAKPSLVMAAFVYLRLSPDFHIRRSQNEVCSAFMVSGMALRNTIKKLAPMLGNRWRGRA